MKKNIFISILCVLSLSFGMIQPLKNKLRKGAICQPTWAIRKKLNRMAVQAIHASDGATLARCLAQGADINTRDAHGNTLLHLAVKQGDKRLVTTLLFYGANKSLCDHEGINPVHWAIKKLQRLYFDEVDERLAIASILTGRSVAVLKKRYRLFSCDRTPPFSPILKPGDTIIPQPMRVKTKEERMQPVFVVPVIVVPGRLPDWEAIEELMQHSFLLSRAIPYVNDSGNEWMAE